jgi:hypothetical protein
MNSDFDKYFELNHWQLESLNFLTQFCGLCGKFVSNNNDYPNQNYYIKCLSFNLNSPFAAHSVVKCIQPAGRLDSLTQIIDNCWSHSDLQMKMS